jgi:hypothetical protein
LLRHFLASNKQTAKEKFGQVENKKGQTFYSMPGFRKKCQKPTCTSQINAQVLLMYYLQSTFYCLLLPTFHPVPTLQSTSPKLKGTMPCFSRQQGHRYVKKLLATSFFKLTQRG